MDICYDCGKSIHRELNCLSDRNQCMCNMGGALVDDLCGTLDESIHIQEDGNLSPLDSPSLDEGEDNSHSGKGINCALEVLLNDEAEFMSVASSPRCSCNCRTSSGKDEFWPVSSDEEDDVCEYLANRTCKVCEYNAYLQSILPKPVKLPSALKGTRDKQGMEQKKLTVTWSPDVHDPPPTSSSHVKSKGLQHAKNNKKNGKTKQKETKQKGKAASRGGGGGKDKKKFGKFSGKSNRGRMAFDDFDDDLEYDDGGSESYYGSSLLKNSIATVHISVGEAL